MCNINCGTRTINTVHVTTKNPKCELIHKGECIGYCPVLKKDAKQVKVKESEDGVYIRCEGCGKVYGREIGFFADCFEPYQQHETD